MINRTVDQSGRRSAVCTGYRLNTGIVVSYPIRAWMYFYVFYVFLLSSVRRGLLKGRSPVKGVLPTHYK